jgi:hypothetical protein
MSNRHRPVPTSANATLANRRPLIALTGQTAAFPFQIIANFSQTF